MTVTTQSDSDTGMTREMLASEGEYDINTYVLKTMHLGPTMLKNKLYSVLASVSCPKALYHLESDNLFRITVVVPDWLG